MLWRVILMTVAAMLVHPALAQTAWPTKPVTLVIPYPAGGGTDILGRQIAEALSARVGQPIIVDNRPGASGNIGAGQVARAPADGYTLMLATSTTMAAGVSLFKELPFDPIKDFAPITELAEVESVLVVDPKLGINSVDELIAYIKANPGKVNYGSGGNATLGHVAYAQLAKIAGLDMVHIPYGGGALAVTALMGGQVQTLMGPVPELLSSIQSGKVKALAISSRKKSASLPDLPLVADTFPDFEVPVWYGLLAPANTPKDVLEKITSDTRAVILSEPMNSKLAQQGYMPVASTSPEFADYISKQIEKWRDLIAVSGARVE